MRWLTRSIATINDALKLLDIYKLLKHSLLSISSVMTPLAASCTFFFYPMWGSEYGEKKREICKVNVKEILWLCVEGLQGPPYRHNMLDFSHKHSNNQYYVHRLLQKPYMHAYRITTN